MKLVDILRLALVAVLVVGPFGVRGAAQASHAHSAAVVQHAEAVATTDCHNKQTSPQHHQSGQDQNHDRSCSILCCAIASTAVVAVVARAPGRLDREILSLNHENWATAPPAPPPRA
jgi:hypothetical protein